MTIVKWIAILFAAVYLGGVLVLYVRQREMLFPIPPVGRTAPDAAGLPEAEEHVLTTSDGEKVIVWHVPARPGRPVILYFPGNGDYLAGRVSRFKAMTADGTGLVALSYRGYAGSSGAPSEEGLLQDAAAAYALHHCTLCGGTNRRLGLFARDRRGGRDRLAASGWKTHPGSSLYVDGRHCCFIILVRSGAPADARSISFR
ncbi:hypothetical protein ACVWWG_001519 [Bradyrhizobium sp. LB7.2]